MVTRKLRDSLNNLSLDLYGTSSKWQKLLKNPNIRAGLGYTIDHKQDRYERQKDGSLRYSHSEDIKMEQTRAISPEEMFQVMFEALKDVRVQQLGSDDVNFWLAYHAATGRLQHHVRLKFEEGAFETETAVLTEEDKAVFKKLYESESGVELDGKLFLENFCLTKASSDEANTRFKNLIDALGLSKYL